MSPKVAITTALVSFWSVSQLYSPEVAKAIPSANQVDNWLRVGFSTLGLGTAVYGAHNTYIRDGEVKRNYTNQNGRVLFSYTANCRDRQNVARFWQHADNGTVTRIIQDYVPRQRRREMVLALINRACGQF
jgi:hypothetical protein